MREGRGLGTFSNVQFSAVTKIEHLTPSLVNASRGVSSLARELGRLAEYQPRVHGLGTACVFTDEIHEERYLFLGY
jgi:hypothetical protein